MDSTVKQKSMMYRKVGRSYDYTHIVLLTISIVDKMYIYIYDMYIILYYMYIILYICHCLVSTGLLLTMLSAQFGHSISAGTHRGPGGRAVIACTQENR